jgi:galactokinase
MRAVPGSTDVQVAGTIMKECPASLDITDGTLRRTSSRFCLGVEHGDYNGAPLLGVGVDRYIWFGYKPNAIGRMRLFSINRQSDGIIDVELGKAPFPLPSTHAESWARFPLGIDHIIRGAGIHARTGIDGVLFGNIPGGGMSRSASLTLNILLSLLDANGIALKDIHVAELAQRVETDYVGSPCGLLDQVMIIFAKKGRATYFNPVSRLVDFVPLPPDGDDFRLVVLDTGTERPGLEKSTYRIRRAECEALVEHLRATGFEIDYLAEITDATYRRITMSPQALPGNLQKRLKYIYQAVRRFHMLRTAWQSGDFVSVGRLFRADGFGLRYDYEISGPELDTMCDIARTVPGVLGERMLGGGDKGAAGAIVRAHAVQTLAQAIQELYPKRHPEYRNLFSVSELKMADGVTVFRDLLR